MYAAASQVEARQPAARTCAGETAHHAVVGAAIKGAARGWKQRIEAARRRNYWVRSQSHVQAARANQAKRTLGKISNRCLIERRAVTIGWCIDQGEEAFGRAGNKRASLATVLGAYIDSWCSCDLATPKYGIKLASVVLCKEHIVMRKVEALGSR
jgi:hypothetical protein